MRIASRGGRVRRAAAAVEFAIVLPVLMFLFGIGVDFARAFYAHLIITNAARHAAVYGADSIDKANDSTTLAAIARRDTTDLSSVTVSSAVTTDADGTQYVTVTVTHPFSSITSLAGVATTLNINQKAVARIQPTVPKSGTYGY